jgi:hypothetical protein
MQVTTFYFKDFYGDVGLQKSNPLIHVNENIKKVFYYNPSKIMKFIPF